MVLTDDIRKGIYIEYKGALYKVIDSSKHRAGRGMGFRRVKLKNLANKKVIDQTFKAGEQVKEVELLVKNMQYLYKDDSGFHFMDSETYEQVTAAEDICSEYVNYIKEGETYQCYVTEKDEIVDLRFPKNVELKVSQAEKGVKGDSATGASKKATVETGYELDVPLFIKEGDILVINTETGKYVERKN